LLCHLRAPRPIPGWFGYAVIRELPAVGAPYEDILAAMRASSTCSIPSAARRPHTNPTPAEGSSSIAALGTQLVGAQRASRNSAHQGSVHLRCRPGKPGSPADPQHQPVRPVPVR
jgi:hypothetical protein